MDTRRIRRTPLPTLAVVALTGTLLAACGSEKADDNDLSGGNTASVLLHPAAGADAGQLDEAAAVLRKRLEYAGVKNGKVTVENGTIKVMVPDGPGGGADALQGIEKDGRLEFRPVLSAARAPAGSGAPTPADSAPQTADPSKYPGVTPELVAAYNALDCTRPGTGTVNAGQSAQVVAACEDKPQDGTLERYLLAPAELTGSDVQSAEAQTPPSGQSGGWQIALKFTTSGADKFTKVTGKLADNSVPTNRFAITLDGRVVIAPSVMQELTGGEAVITGQFTKSEATRTAAVLRTGNLPVALTADPVVTNSAK
ncbi:SecDF P1 head subdomain-containing protein [Uniformispora flossi]|uniref:SecDF P1 head subdomain-containing protein n=1 Tax=Uniformispora flossi TaxID=3390723 RepID=UPI003C2C75C9